MHFTNVFFPEEAAAAQCEDGWLAAGLCQVMQPLTCPLHTAEPVTGQ